MYTKSMEQGGVGVCVGWGGGGVGIIPPTSCVGFSDVCQQTVASNMIFL